MKESKNWKTKKPKKGDEAILMNEIVIERKVKQFGTGGAHIILPKKLLGKTVLLIAKNYKSPLKD